MEPWFCVRSPDTVTKRPEPDITTMVQNSPSDPVRPGDSVTLQCSVLSDYENKTCPGEHSVYWFRAGSDGAHPTLIYVQRNNSDQCEKSPEAHSPQKCVYNFSKNVSSSDAGTYHCAVATCGEILFGDGRKLDIQGNTQRTSNYTVVQWLTVSDSVHPGDLMTLQCSVLSDSENKTCPGDHNVYWFKTGSDKSHPNIIYTDGNRHDECDKRSDTQKSCIYRFSKSVSSSDAGTYYCAVATCGEILFGNGTKVEIEDEQYLTAPRWACCKAFIVMAERDFQPYLTPPP
ncbi:hypothetical protein L3Q82_020368 [Scortum barcoo]|uniref:Uncharacterized protein n=1 Tax=Scortum barcoo TaxID=214431 RepID=A0ACB8V7B4_9TELE|nr:hypothetical protein L3Q82_020368 [Scortum barcoo]